MIDFHFETDFSLIELSQYADWITRVIDSEGSKVAQIDYIFCDDDYLLNVNEQYLNHDTFTDIITFDYTVGNTVAGDIFISVDRLKENAVKFRVSLEAELLRVMAHGVLHLMGYKDKSDRDSDLMRSKENEKMELFHVEQ